jgi:hypothetical protein
MRRIIRRIYAAKRAGLSHINLEIVMLTLSEVEGEASGLSKKRFFGCASE